jgi:hypothetical protein
VECDRKRWDKVIPSGIYSLDIFIKRTSFHLSTETILSDMFSLHFLIFSSCASVVIGAPNLIASRASPFKYLISLSVAQFLNFSQDSNKQKSGDSYSQTGFSITGTKPSTSNPIGNPAFPGYTTTGGNNVSPISTLSRLSSSHINTPSG